MTPSDATQSSSPPARLRWLDLIILAFPSLPSQAISVTHPCVDIKEPNHDYGQGMGMHRWLYFCRKLSLHLSFYPKDTYIIAPSMGLG